MRRQLSIPRSDLLPCNEGICPALSCRLHHIPREPDLSLPAHDAEQEPHPVLGGAGADADELSEWSGCDPSWLLHVEHRGFRGVDDAIGRAFGQKIVKHWLWDFAWDASGIAENIGDASCVSHGGPETAERLSEQIPWKQGINPSLAIRQVVLEQRKDGRIVLIAEFLKGDTF